MTYKILVDGVVRDATPEEAAEFDAAKANAVIESYKMNRAMEYPSFADQFDLLYHGGYDAWKATIQAVKDKYPKGE